MKVCAHHATSNRSSSLLLCTLYGLSSALMAEGMVLDGLAMSQVGLETDAVLRETMEDVKKSGYYYLICSNIEESWRLCDPNTEHKEDDLIPEYQDCTEESDEEKQKQCQRVKQY